MRADLQIPARHPNATELIRAKVPMVIRTYPNPETHFRVTVTKPDQFFRANGKIISRNLAAHILRKH